MEKTVNPPHVVILGGGFGGLYAARALARHPVRITLVDRKNHHTFQPLLYQGAAAENIARDLRSEPRQNFRYRDRGNLATIGRAAAVADFGRMRISGLIAWRAWLTIHIFWLIGFRNRLLVFIQWTWAYITYQRGTRLITGDPELPGRAP